VPASTTEVAVPNTTLVDDFLWVTDAADDGFTGIRMDSSFNALDAGAWMFANDDGDLLIKENLTDDRLALVEGGKVGVGTAAPAAQLHVAGPQPQLMLDDNAGASHFLIQNSSGLFLGRPGPIIEVFIANDAPSASLILEDTGVGIGTLTPEAQLHVNGSGIIEGDFRASSSRDTKKNLETAAAAELLAQLAELEIFTWSYKDDPADARHVGPVAEDFYERFGLGHDNKHISPSDTAGLALAAIQRLHKMVQEQEWRDEKQQQLIAEQQAQIVELRELVLAQQALAGSPQ
jgi:hypothetical protein